MLKRTLQVLTLALVLGVAPAVVLRGVSYADGTVNWTGNGVTDGQFDTTQCEGDTPNPGDVLWVFTAAGADSATITINGQTSSMTQEGNGAFHFVETGFNGDFASLSASATFVGDVNGDNTPKLVISHGCPGSQEQTDVCANIEGVQTEVPAGMVVDNQGNCTTPNNGGNQGGGGQVLGENTTATVTVTPQGGVNAGAGGGSALSVGSL